MDLKNARLLVTPTSYGKNDTAPENRAGAAGRVR